MEPPLAKMLIASSTARLNGWSITSWCWPLANTVTTSLLLSQNGSWRLHLSSSELLMPTRSVSGRGRTRSNHCTTRDASHPCETCISGSRIY
jgi:hypothetical protein